MTNRQKIQALNRSEDAQGIRKFLERMEAKFRMTYADHKNFWTRCDPTIDAARFEELMQIADYAGSA